MMYGGIDLHSNNSVVAVINDADRIVAQKRLPNDLTKVVGFLSQWQGELAGVVVESTYNWYWLVDGLEDAGFRVHLANTAAIKQYDGLKHCTTRRMRVTSRICCDWGSCRPARSCRGTTARCAIWRASGCNWCTAGPRTSSRSRTS